MFFKSNTINLKYTDHPPTGITEILDETEERGSRAPIKNNKKGREQNHYYPFGLKHDGYTHNHQIFEFDPIAGNVTIISIPQNATDGYNYKYNRKELQEELNLNIFDLGARHYDPAIARFLVPDPMTDFINHQSPYVMADNNPVIYVDEYGMGILRVIGNLFSRAAFGVKKLFSGNKCDCRRFQGESLRDAWNMPDFPGNNNDRSSISNSRNKSRNKSNNNTSIPKREKISSIELPMLSPPIVPALEINEPNNILPIGQKTSRPIPTFRGEPISSGAIVNLNISFMQSRFLIEPSDSNLKILNDLVKTLKEYPEIKILLSGNMLTSNSDNKTVKTLEGKMSVSNFKNARAKAILKILEKRGIPSSRIKTQSGNSDSMSIDAIFIYKR